MKLEHFGMAEPGDCRLVFTASAEELAAALAKEQAAPDAPQDEEELLTAAVNRTILEGFDPLYRQLVQEQQLDRKSTRLNSSHNNQSRMPSSA